VAGTACPARHLLKASVTWTAFEGLSVRKLNALANPGAGGGGRTAWPTQRRRQTPHRKLRMPLRCSWAESDPLLRGYHDEEWGVVEHDGRALWEALMLDGFQAGLAWITVLRKRDDLREAFASFDSIAVARFGPRSWERRCW
jgi:hypothetical protein